MSLTIRRRVRDKHRMNALRRFPMAAGRFALILLGSVALVGCATSGSHQGAKTGKVANEEEFAVPGEPFLVKFDFIKGAEEDFVLVPHAGMVKRAKAIRKEAIPAVPKPPADEKKDRFKLIFFKKDVVFRLEKNGPPVTVVPVKQDATSAKFWVTVPESLQGKQLIIFVQNDSSLESGKDDLVFGLTTVAVKPTMGIRTPVRTPISGKWRR